MSDQMYVGKFNLKTDVIIATDPCYDKEEKNFIYNCLPGKWHASIELFDSRVKSLTITHKKYNSTPLFCYAFLFKQGVDSGQFGFFEAETYPEVAADYDDESAFYRKVCDKLEQEQLATDLENGAVAYSGYGDGLYKVYVYPELVAGKEKVISIRVVFIEKD